ncbi:MAG: hypothetical protein NVSMB65_04830 [Chloroflexota bacterium]
MNVVFGLAGLVVVLIVVRTVQSRIAEGVGGAQPSTPTGPTTFVPVETVAALDPLFAPSTGPVVLFLHDPFCPISAGAYRQMTRLGSEVALVNVQRARDISHSIEQSTGVRHESPQVIILKHGRAVWSASHGAITAPAVLAAVRKGS